LRVFWQTGNDTGLFSVHCGAEVMLEDGICPGISITQPACRLTEIFIFIFIFIF
jgi:hypothetical protein